jgi:branched-chain amino acid aminotransferase
VRSHLPGISLPLAGRSLCPRSAFILFPCRFISFAASLKLDCAWLRPSTRHVPPECVDPKIKNRSRLHWWLAEQEAHLVDEGAMPLLLDLQGNLTETSGSNLLLVRDGTVYSPTPRNILLGISRKVVIELCAKLQIPFVERDLQVHDRSLRTKHFVTTSPYCMAPVTRFNGVTIGDGAVGGPIYNRLLQAWSDQAGVDIRAQVLGLKAANSIV